MIFDKERQQLTYPAPQLPQLCCHSLLISLFCLFSFLSCSFVLKLNNSSPLTIMFSLPVARQLYYNQTGKRLSPCLPPLDTPPSSNISLYLHLHSQRTYCVWHRQRRELQLELQLQLQLDLDLDLASPWADWSSPAPCAANTISLCRHDKAVLSKWRHRPSILITRGRCSITHTALRSAPRIECASVSWLSNGSEGEFNRPLKLVSADWLNYWLFSVWLTEI